MKKKVVFTLLIGSAMMVSAAGGALAASKIKLIVNGNVPQAEVKVINGTSYVPLRSVSQLLGANVNWDDTTSTITITNGSNDPAKPTPSTTTPEPAKDELGKGGFIRYLDQVRPVLNKLGEIAISFDKMRQDSVEGKLSDQEFILKITKEILPGTTKVQDEIEKIFPDKEFRPLHEKLIAMIAKQQQAMTEIIASPSDASKLTSANKLLAETRELDRETFYDLQELSKKYNVPLKK